MDKFEGMAVIAVAMLLVAGTGALFFYDQAREADRERDELAIREEIYSSLMSLETEVQDEMVSASRNLTHASLMLSGTGLNGTAARAIMKDVLTNVTNGINVVTIDTSGVIVAAEPSSYHSVEGTDISEQSQVQRMLSSHLPVMSEVFTMVEGFMASDMEIPVFDGNGTFIGSISVTLDVEGIIRDKVEALDLSVGYQITCLQDDGLEVFDTDEDQIGRNLFTDPAYENYTETLDFMREMLRSSNGYGTYEYYQTLESQELVTKEVYWSSFGMHGISWTLMFIHVL
jgi:branched-chain amino acid transport system substrate-binding protein